MKKEKKKNLRKRDDDERAGVCFPAPQAWYARAAVMPVHNKDDQAAHDEAEALLKASP
jgi:hypothetical protein